jgi:hypothetical protein
MLMSTERTASAGSAAQAPPTANSSTASVTVEEVLRVEDGGYHSTAYLVRWNNKRVAVIDVLSSTSHQVGDQFQVLALHVAVAGQKILQFTALPLGAPNAASGHDAPDAGIVEQVLDSKFDGDSYTAYLIGWHGAHVAVAVQGPAATLYRAGDSLPLVVSRRHLPNGGGGILGFTAGPSADQGASDEAALNSPANMSSATVTATVERVLTAQVDDFHYRAYLVPWHGALVVVDDAFATTHYNAGDQISFLAARAANTGARYVTFLLFAFPCPPSTACKSCAMPTQPAAASH